MMVCSHKYTKAQTLSAPFLDISQEPILAFPLASELGSLHPAFSRLKGVFLKEGGPIVFHSRKAEGCIEGDCVVGDI